MDLFLLTSSSVEDNIPLIVSIIAGVLFILIFIPLSLNQLQKEEEDRTVFENLKVICDLFNLKITEETHRSSPTPANYVAKGQYRNRALYLRLYQIRERRSSGDSSRIVYVWYMEYTWQVTNPNKVRLALAKESIWDRIDKNFGVDYSEDFPVHHEDFDKHFIVACSHKDFAAKMLNDRWYDQMVELHKYFSFDYLETENNKIIHKSEQAIEEPMEFELLKRSLKATYQLAEAMDNYSPQA